MALTILFKSRSFCDSKFVNAVRTSSNTAFINHSRKNAIGAHQTDFRLNSLTRDANKVIRLQQCISVRSNRSENHLVPSLLYRARPSIQCHKCFHTSARKSVPPIFWILIKPIAKVASIIGGRFGRKWWQKLPGEEKTEWKRHIYTHRHKLYAALGLLLGAGVINYVSHLQETPITHRKRYIAFTQEQFLKICQYEYEQQFEANKEKIVPPSHKVYKIVKKVVTNIVNANQDLDFMAKQKWTIIVIDDPSNNAFVLPTGHIFVFKGILQITQNENQLAVVLGHEMAHALLNHGAEQVSVAQVLDVFVIFAMAFIWFFMPTDGLAIVTQWFYNKVTSLLLHLPYSRKLEAEADEVGLQLIAKACYDVRESSNFWNLMSTIEAAEAHAEGEEPVEMPQWLSTHPSNESRAQKLDELLPQALDLRALCKCGPLPPYDPKAQLLLLKNIVNGDQHNPKNMRTEVTGTSQC